MPKPVPGTPSKAVPDPLADRLFDQTDARGAPLHVYAVLDAAKVQFLPDRLDQSGLPHQCLYRDEDDEDIGETAPWLVQLQPDAPLTRQFFTADPSDSFRLLDHEPGILIRASTSLPDLARHLRRYTTLVDEDGVREFFRFQEPGMLDAILGASPVEEVATFFTGLHDFLYLIPSLTTNRWDVIEVGASANLGAGPPAILKLDTVRRRALRQMVDFRRARTLAIETGDTVPDREARTRTYERLMNAGFDDPTGLISAHKLLDKVPDEARPSFWEAVESGEHSLRFLLVKLARHYQLETELR